MIKSCPECGEPLQATLPLYVTDIELNDEGEIVSFDLDFTWDYANGGPIGWDDWSGKVYCKNDHPCDAYTGGVDLDRMPRVTL